jgi:hypothetical protein
LKIKTSFVLALALQAAATGSYAQLAPNVKTAGIEYNLARIQDSAWQNRQEAFYALLQAAPPALRLNGYAVPSATVNVLRSDPFSADSVKLVLTNLLERENALTAKGAPDLTDDYSDYYADVIASVASLSDIRTIDALIGAIETGGLATTGLGKLGAAAFDKTAAVYASGSAERRESALMVFSAMLDEELTTTTPNTALRKAIEAVLLHALSDRNPHVRLAAIEGASKLRTPALLAGVRNLAQQDRYEASEHGGDRGVFLVRDAAERALK